MIVSSGRAPCLLTWPTGTRAGRAPALSGLHCRIDGAGKPSGHADQDAYSKGLAAPGSVDHIQGALPTSSQVVSTCLAREVSRQPERYGVHIPPGSSWAELSFETARRSAEAQ